MEMKHLNEIQDIETENKIEIFDTSNKLIVRRRS